MSSSIFDGISAGMVRQPQVSMNAGPLPTAAPPYFPSARINYASDLLGEHIDAYSYGKADHVSDQTAYLNIAHRIQKIVPQISLPNASSEGTFQLSHAVDVGDIGFVLRIDRRGGVVPNIHAFDRLQLGRMVDPMVNLVTVNYILAGLQRFWTKREVLFSRIFFLTNILTHNQIKKTGCQLATIDGGPRIRRRRIRRALAIRCR